MDYDLIEVRGGDGRELGIVVGGYVVFTLTPSLWAELEEVCDFDWLRSSSDMPIEERQARFDAWRERLPKARYPSPVDASAATMAQAVATVTAAPGTMPQPPAIIYGHLPHRAITGPAEIFYRCEAFPRSRYIDQITRMVHHRNGLYALPSSEILFIPTGFAAVGRYALPGLLPATFRWELQPPNGTMIRCGASVPLYGQAGGGVEVRFDTSFTNRGPIASPVILPPL